MESAKSHLELDKMETNGSHVRMFTPEVPKPVREKRENICVYVRVRPTNAIEKAKGATLIVDCPSQREVYVKGRDTMGSGSKTFSFDKVFGPNSKQIEVYKAVVGPLLEEVLQGYNCTVFAYGQTGTGKTFTMEGDRTKEVSYTWETDPLAGIVPRAMNQLFDELRVKGSDSEFTVRVSLVEMYNEEVYDLLSPAEDAKPKSVKLFEDPSKKGSVYIQGLEEVIVRNKHEVYSIMERGSQMRKTASTLLNATSSRSHTVFTVTVHLKETSLIGEDLVKIGKLNLVDLAGSENIGRSGAIEKRAREAGNINQSLLTLGRVITALVEKAPHVPYRESKLTRLLQDSLGGKTKTSIIATISPASNNIEETLSTLDYAHRAKNIQNRPEVNQKMTKKAMLKEYTDEIERLRKDLAAAREKNGIYVDKENYDQIMSQIESQSQDLSEKIQYVKSIEEDVVNKEQIIMEKDAIINETKEELKAADLVILGLREKIAELEKKNSEIENEKQEMEHLVNVHSTTESKLSTEAKTLLNTTKETTTTLDCLYNRLERKKSVETANLEAGKRFRADADEQLRGLAKEVSHFGEREAGFAGKQRMKLNDHLSQKESSARAIEEFVMESNAQVKSLMEKVYEALEKQQNVVQKGLRDQLQLEHVQTDQLRSDLSNHCESMSKSSDDVRQKINYQSGKLNEFWDSTYLIDLPTGATPQRKMYEYPSALSATSPHARILERYRAVKFPKLSELEVEPDSPPVENQSPPNELIEPLSTSTEEDDEVFGENINPATSTSSSSDNLTGLASAAAPLPKGKGKFGGRLVSDSTANNASTKMSAKSNASKSNLQKKLSRKVLISANSN